MPALAIIVMLLMSIWFSFSQYASVPATSRNGRPEEKPKNSIVHAAGCANARQTDGLAGAAVTDGLVGIVDRKRRVIRKPRRRRDRARFRLQRRRGDLIIDAPADVIRARRTAIAPPRVFDSVRLHDAETVTPTLFRRWRAVAAFVGNQRVEPGAFGRQTSG